MTDIDKIADTTEALIEKIKSLKYKFHTQSLEDDAAAAKEEAITALETWLEAVTHDYEQTSEEDSLLD
jgi:hypothetical protein